MAVSAAILEIFNVKEWPDLEIWVWGPSRSLKKVRFDRPNRLSRLIYFLLVRHCNYSSILYHLRVIWRWIISWPLKSGLEVPQGHWNFHYRQLSSYRGKYRLPNCSTQTRPQAGCQFVPQLYRTRCPLIPRLLLTILEITSYLLRLGNHLNGGDDLYVFSLRHERWQVSITGRH